MNTENTLKNNQTDPNTSKHTGIFWLAVAAWLIEVMASGVGLSLAFFNTSTGMGEDFNIQTFLISGGFVFGMIAILELCKIPLVDTIYKTKSFIFRIFFSFCLVLFTIITVETAYMALQRNYNDSIRKLLVGYDKINKLEEKIKQIDSSSNKKDDKLETLQTRLANRVTMYNSEIKIIDDQIKPIDERIKVLRQDNIDLNRQNLSQSNVTSPKITKAESQSGLAREEIKRLEQNKLQRLKQVQEQCDDNVRLIEGKYEKRISSKESFKSQLQKELFVDKEKMDKTEKEISDLTKKSNDEVQQSKEQCIAERTKQETEFNNAIKAEELKIEQAEDIIAKEIAILTKNIENSQGINTQKITTNGKDIEKLKNDIQGLKKQKQNITQKFNDDKSNLEKQIQDTKNISTSFSSDGIDALKARTQYQDKILEQQEKISETAQQISIYQMARATMRLFRENDTQKDETYVSQEELDTFATIWFGSLSILVGVLGSILYLAYLVQTHPPKPFFRPMLFLQELWYPIKNTITGIAQFFSLNRNFDDKPAPTMRGWFRNGTNELLQSMAKWFKEPRPEKIVYTDKTVEKIVEVEKEVIRKELVHVPLYTNDISKIKTAQQAWSEKGNDKNEDITNKSMAKDEKTAIDKAKKVIKKVTNKASKAKKKAKK